MSCPNLLTIITPTFDLVKAGRVATFRQCVESVYAQACRGSIEHIVVDGGSTDGTDSIFDEYRKKNYFRVVVKKDHSIYEGINNGLLEACGKYVLCLNSDDYLVAGDALSEALALLESSGADYLYGDVNVVAKDGRPLRVWRGNLSELPYAKHYCHQSMIVKRDVLNALGGFDLQYRISADSDIMLRLYHDSYSAVHCPRVFANFRSGGVSGAHSEIAKRDHATAFYNYFGREVGLSIEDCMSLWCYNGIGRLPYVDALRILVALPEYEWRIEWLRKMQNGYEGDLWAVNKMSVLRRLCSKVKRTVGGLRK